MKLLFTNKIQLQIVKMKLKAQWMLKCYKKNRINSRLRRIGKYVRAANFKKKNIYQKKILFAMSFSIFEPNRVHDFLLSESLALRGAKIIPVICGGLQKWQCCVYGGVWGGYVGDESKDSLIHEKNCQNCINCDLTMWKEWGGIDPIFLTTYITDEDKCKTFDCVETYNISDYKNWMYDDIPVGLLILDVIRNNELLNDETIVFNLANLVKSYLYNIILLTKAMKKVIDEISPDTVVSNNTFYYPWAIMESICLKKGIKIYCSGTGGRRNSWSYALNQLAKPVDKNISDMWKTWKCRDLTPKEDACIAKYLDEMRSGKDMVLNTANVSKYYGVSGHDNTAFDFSKPTALLATNVIWDAAILRSDSIFTNMFDWVNTTIDFFEKHPEYQLIIKAHPAENHKLIPAARQGVFDQIMKNRDILPSNVIFIGPRSSITLYDLLRYVNLGLVYTSTVGIECACRGIPVVVAAQAPYIQKGFSFDPDTQSDYFDQISFLMKNKLSQERKIEIMSLSKKFAYIYHFLAYLKLDFLKWDYYGNIDFVAPSKLLPGRCIILDYICNSILNGLPIVSAERHPPVIVNGNIITKAIV